MTEWKPKAPIEVYDPEIEETLFKIVDDAVPSIYAKHDSSRQTNHFTENGVLLPKLTIIDSAGLTDQVDPELSFDQEVLRESLKVIGRDHDAVKSRFAESNIDVTPVLSASLEIGEGTEKNLPWYHGEQFVTFKDYETLVAMLGGWTSEEATHGELVELVALGASLYDEKKSVAIQTALLRGGIGVPTISLAAINAYTDPQERLTFVAHQSSARLAGESGGKALTRLSGQENRHKFMFRAIGKALYGANDPIVIDYLLQMEAAVMAYFSMPGSKSFPRYAEIAKLLASSGLFTFDHQRESFAERTNALGIADISPKIEEAQNAQQWILDYIQPDSQLHARERKGLGLIKKRYERGVRAKGLVPFIVGDTVEIDRTEFKPAA